MIISVLEVVVYQDLVSREKYGEFCFASVEWEVGFRDALQSVSHAVTASAVIQA